MKLFIHDEKHETLLAELDLGELTDLEEKLLHKVVDFLDREGVTNRYNELVLAHSYEYRNYDGENIVSFEY
jgi:hypothetical protein